MDYISPFNSIAKLKMRRLGKSDESVCNLSLPVIS